MNGLEAIELMKQGKVVVRVDTRTLYQLHNNRVEGADHIGRWNDNRVFNVNSEYEEYIEPKPLTGWERVEDGERYRTIDECSVWEYREDNDGSDVLLYNIANYFSTKEKAEEINFKQTLFRKLQRFSDENGGNEIDWENTNQKKYCILYCHSFKELQSDFTWVRQNQGQIYFISKEIAEKAIMLFHDDLIKYFTHDWSGKDETPINLNPEER